MFSLTPTHSEVYSKQYFVILKGCVLCAQCYQCLCYSFLIVFVLGVVCSMLPVSVLFILDCLRPVCCVPNVTSGYIIHS